MPDLQAINRELDRARERDDHQACVGLISAALALPGSQPDRAGYLDSLAFTYEKLGRFDEAIDAMRQAVAAGWEGELDDHASAQALIADLLLRAGRDEEADEAWAQAERDDPRNPWVHSAASDAYTRGGLYRKALRWQPKGLKLALEAGEEEGELAWYLTGERGQTMDALGLEPDELQLRAEELIEPQEQQDREYEQEFLRRWREPHTIAPQRASIGVAWFPPDEYQRALHTWPSFAEDYQHGPYAAYCARLELLLRDLKSQGVKRLGLTPITIDEYLAWCAQHDRDSEDADSRASYATELVGRDAVHPWPPQRNEHCWCGSERKYKSAAFERGDTLRRRVIAQKCPQNHLV